jgi:twitching motility protein PilI
MSWLGVRAGALNLLIPVGEVVEVMHPGIATPVPLTQPWFDGLHNVRGSLYSAIDLPALLGFAPVPAGPEARMLLLPGQRMRNTALLVNRLNGMLDAAALVAPPEQPPLQPLPALRRAAMEALFGRRWLDAQQAEWHEFDLDALLALPEFLEVAALPVQGVTA